MTFRSRHLLVRFQFNAATRFHTLAERVRWLFIPTLVDSPGRLSSPTHETGANDHQDRSGAWGGSLPEVHFKGGDPVGSEVRVCSAESLERSV